ncbi:unnamed protein product [Cladocopium goreaui]|uniref:Poly(U)-specific endoribonuclease n=1 Tax=Cladocopium goreaui TaxID=2562237 RepID=A0A9P1DSI1_9DINO|nr:unnamed protein product [Cladocopium goreaui]
MAKTTEMSTELGCVRSEAAVVAVKLEATEVLEARSLLDSTIKEKASMEEQLAVLQPKVNQLEQQAAVASDVLKELQPEVKETRARLARSEEDKCETHRDLAQLRASMEKTKVELDAWEQTHAVLVQTVNSHRYVATLSERSSSLDADTHAHEVRLSQQAALIENPSADLDQTSEQVLEARSLLDTTIKEKASMEEQLAVLEPKVNQLEQQAAVANDAMKDSECQSSEEATSDSESDDQKSEDPECQSSEEDSECQSSYEVPPHEFCTELADLELQVILWRQEDVLYNKKRFDELEATLDRLNLAVNLRLPK